MIRVVITGPPTNGRFPYRVETEGTRLAHPVTSLSAVPMFDACKMLLDLSAADGAAEIGLFSLDDDQTAPPHYSMQVRFGAERPIVETPTGPKMTSTTAKGVLPEEQRSVTEVIERDELNAEPTATPEEAPPPPRKLQAHRGGKDRAEPEPDKPKRLHRKPKPAGSGGRRGRR
jgi:hypothetical protein